MTEAITEITAAEQVERLKEQLAATRAERDADTRVHMDQLSAAQARLEDFKIQVHVVASAYAREHSWCDVVSDALQELGLERMEEEFEIPVQVRLTLIRRLAVKGASRSAAGERAVKLVEEELTSEVRFSGVYYTVADSLVEVDD